MRLDRAQECGVRNQGKKGLRRRGQQLQGLRRERRRDCILRRDPGATEVELEQDGKSWGQEVTWLLFQREEVTAGFIPGD